jgi:hypothetical protein
MRDQKSSIRPEGTRQNCDDIPRVNIKRGCRVTFIPGQKQQCVHMLQVNPSARPRKKRLCKRPDEKVAAAKAEVQRLLDVRFIHEIDYPSWLTNVVMVKKKNGK